MKGSFESIVTMPSGVIYECEISKGYFSNIGNEREKSCWLTRTIDKYSVEKILMHLGSRHLFISIYINGQDASGVINPTGEQIAKLLGSELSLEDTFEYCRKVFCSDLSGIGTKPKAEKKQQAVIAQPDLFEMA